MRQINPMAKAWANVERSQHKAAMGEAFKRKDLKSATRFLEGTHRYERTFSDTPVGEFRDMNGREAKELNDALFETYLAAARRNKKGRALERWKLVQKFILPQTQLDPQTPSDHQTPV